MNPAIEAWLEAVSGLTISLPGSLSLVVAGTILGILVTVRRAETLGVGPDVTLSNLTWVLAFALLGARAAHWLENSDALSLADLFVVWRGGLSFYGGVFGGLVGVLIAPGGRDRQWLLMSDAGAFGFAAGLVISHLGCFLNGDDFGRPTSAPWAVSFPAGSPAHAAHVGKGLIAPDAAASLPVHPTQIYEMAFGALLLVVLHNLAAKRPRPGMLILAAVGGYACFRLVLERFREPSSPLVAEHFSVGQVWSVLCLAFVVLGFASFRRKLRPASCGSIDPGRDRARRTAWVPPTSRSTVRGAVGLLSGLSRAKGGDEAESRRASFSHRPGPGPRDREACRCWRRLRRQDRAGCLPRRGLWRSIPAP